MWKKTTYEVHFFVSRISLLRSYITFLLFVLIQTLKDKNLFFFNGQVECWIPTLLIRALVSFFSHWSLWVKLQKQHWWKQWEEKRVILPICKKLHHAMCYYWRTVGGLCSWPEVTLSNQLESQFNWFAPLYNYLPFTSCSPTLNLL